MQMDELIWFNELFSTWSATLYPYLYAMLRNKGRLGQVSEIEDCIQETFVVLWTKRESLMGHRNIGAWLLKTSSNIMANKLTVSGRRERRTAFSVDESYKEGSESIINRIDFVQKSDQENSRELLDEIKEAVGDETFKLLISYYDKEKPIENLTQEYGLSKSGVKMRVKRSLENLKKKLFFL